MTLSATAVNKLAKLLHDHVCGCSTYCSERQDGRTWHEDARSIMSSLFDSGFDVVKRPIGPDGAR